MNNWIEIIKKEIEDKIQQLERDRIGYLEADDKAGARRKEKQISELQDKLEIINLKEIKEDLELYKKFIKKRGLQNEFQRFMIIEIANKKNNKLIKKKERKSKMSEITIIVLSYTIYKIIERICETVEYLNTEAEE